MTSEDTFYPTRKQALDLAMHVKKEAEFQLMFKMAGPMIKGLKSNDFSSPNTTFFESQLNLKRAISTASTKDSDSEDIASEPQANQNSKNPQMIFGAESSKFDFQGDLENFEELMKNSDFSSLKVKRNSRLTDFKEAGDIKKRISKGQRVKRRRRSQEKKSKRKRKTHVSLL